MRILLSRTMTQSDFVKKVEELSGESLMACYQCGKCSAGCPIVSEMDILPNQLLRLLQLGDVASVQSCRTAWLCAACQTCVSRCPKGINISKVAEALRVIVLRSGVDRIEVPRLSEEMLSKVPQQGLVSGFRKFTS
jgi:heterodisulfide reductase subunit C